MEAAGKLVDDIAKAVVTHAFVAHTAEDLTERRWKYCPINLISATFGHTLLRLATHSVSHVA